MKKIFAVFLFLILCFSTSLAFASDAKKVTFKTISLITTEPNYIINDVYKDLEHGYLTFPEYDKNNDKLICAPLQDIITKGLRGEFIFDQATKTITIKVDDYTVVLTIDSNIAYVNDVKVEIESVPYIKDGRIFLPFNFVMESLGGETRWEPKRKKIVATVPVVLRKETLGYEIGGDTTLETIFKQDATWYLSSDAIKVADAFLSYQNDDGGWPKVDPKINLLKPVSVKDTSTIDNNSTFDQMKFLAIMYKSTHSQKYKDAFDSGLDYILDGQHESGGWPQFFPNAEGYLKMLAFNDNSITNILEVMRDISNKEDMYSFVDDKTAQKCKTAFDTGINFILQTQVKVGSVKTVWAAQYDPDTLSPTRARIYELPSLSGQESVGIVKLLMSIENPSKEIIDSIQGAVKWFDLNKIEGYKVLNVADDSISTGKDRVLVEDKDSIIWGRFLEIGTNKPIFAGRDGIKKYNFNEVPIERRANYSYYTAKPLELYKDYPAWQQKNAPNADVLAK